MSKHTPLPCPFCGGEPKLIDDLIAFHVECNECGSSGSVSSYESGAIDAWNRRKEAAIAKATGEQK